VLYLIGAGILLAVLAALTPWIGEARRIAKTAREDHAGSRGTHHAKQLREAIRLHERHLQPLRGEHTKLQAELNGIARREQAELERALTQALIDSSFLKIPGIGPKLRDRILGTCFDGSLDSLLRAHQVYGVGQEKSFAIRNWVQQMRRGFTSRLEEDFPGKSEVQAKHSARSEELARRLKSLSSRIARREEVVAVAGEHLAPLERTTPRTFRRALRGDQPAAERVGAYVTGAFAEWEPLPDWFAAILKEPDEA